MRTLLISPSILNADRDAFPHFDMRTRCTLPLGIPIVREVLKHDYDVKMLLYDHTINDIQEILKESAKSDVTGFSVAHFLQYPAIRQIVEKIRQEKIDTKVVFGGVFSTYHAHYLCKDGVDVVINGEGERVVPHLLKTLETGNSLNSVKGITYRDNGALVDTGPAPLTDLESVPFPCYDELPLLDADYKHVSCETSRGCWNTCSFCAIYPRGKWRGYSPEKSLAAMEHAYEYQKHSKVPYIFITDSNFAANMKRIRQIADLIEDEIPSYCPMRLESVNEKTIKYFQKIGIKAVITGVEAASEQTLVSINKHLRLTSIEKKLQMLIDHGMIPRTTFILGLPGENRDSVLSTVRYIKRLVRLLGKDLHVLVFPFRQDIAGTAADFEKYKSFKTLADALVATDDRKFRLWVLALEYLVNVYHDVLEPDEQIAALDMLIKRSATSLIEHAKTYDGDVPSWLLAFQRYLRELGNEQYSLDEVVQEVHVSM